MDSCFSPCSLISQVCGKDNDLWYCEIFWHEINGTRFAIFHRLLLFTFDTMLQMNFPMKIVLPLIAIYAMYTMYTVFIYLNSTRPLAAAFDGVVHYTVNKVYQTLLHELHIRSVRLSQISLHFSCSLQSTPFWNLCQYCISTCFVNQNVLWPLLSGLLEVVDFLWIHGCCLLCRLLGKTVSVWFDAVFLVNEVLLMVKVHFLNHEVQRCSSVYLLDVNHLVHSLAEQSKNTKAGH